MLSAYNQLRRVIGRISCTRHSTPSRRPRSIRPIVQSLEGRVVPSSGKVPSPVPLKLVDINNNGEICIDPGKQNRGTGIDALLAPTDPLLEGALLKGPINGTLSYNVPNPGGPPRTVHVAVFIDQITLDRGNPPVATPTILVYTRKQGAVIEGQPGAVLPTEITVDLKYYLSYHRNQKPKAKTVEYKLQGGQVVICPGGSRYQ